MSNIKTPQEVVVSDTRTRQIEPPLGQKPKSSMAKQVFERFDGHELTDDMLCEAVHLFNENYGIWGDVPKPGRKPGMFR